MWQPYQQDSTSAVSFESDLTISRTSGDHSQLTLQVPSSPTANSLSGDTFRSRASSFNSTADTARSRASSDVRTLRSRFEGDDVSPEEALRPDNKNEKDFEVVNSPFAFSPGQLNKMLNPKSLAAFKALGGIRGLETGLQTDTVAGLSVDETSVSRKVSFEEATKSAYTTKKEAARPILSQDGLVTNYEIAGQYHDRKRIFTDNRLPPKKSVALWRLFWNAFNDRILLILTGAAFISLALGVYEAVGQKRKPGEPRPLDWVEGLAIMVAVVIVVLVTGLNDYRREKQFAALNAKKDDRQVKAVRSGKTVMISVFDVMVGDILHLESGDSVPADGILISGHGLKCDESSATGESDAMRKTAGHDVWTHIEEGKVTPKLDPFIISGSKVLEGVGMYLVISVGVNSSFGKIMMSLQTPNEDTPLQVKLAVMANWIGYIGTAAASLLFFILLIRFLVRLPADTESPAMKGSEFLNILIVAITIIVVAVPEGLPVAVTLALSFATKKMLKEHNLVRHLRACETMGNATTICSDKTGTLTQNRMTVVAGVLGPNGPFDLTGSTYGNNVRTLASAFSLLSPAVRNLLIQSCGLNSTAFEGEIDGEFTFIGSKIETAILTMAKNHLGMGPVAEERAGAEIVQFIPFDSNRKCMGIVIRLASGSYRLLVKGAAEILLATATTTLADIGNDNLDVHELSVSKTELATDINDFAAKSLRTIAMVYRDFQQWPPHGARISEEESLMVDFDDIFKDMTLLAIFGIQDPLREGVSQAVQQCQDAGVMVRMVTGDNMTTASAIATQCGILKEAGVVMEGPKFRRLSENDIDQVLPNLQVLARSSPADKRILVSRLKHLGETVAVTGDGTNDGPALKIADVGFSMGIAGTEVAKEASAIILMDDNFSSIVKAIMWGRSVNDAVAKFLQFQITVNITAVVLAFISAVASSESHSVLSAVQLLWVNLIMDTFAALALATDAPTEKILDRKPTPKRAALITTNMWKMIVGQAIYQLVVTFVLYFAGAKILGYDLSANGGVLGVQLDTMVFNTFVWMQIFNEFNNRRLDNKLNIFEGVLKNYWFIGINVIMIGGQIMIIYVGGKAFQVTRLNGTQWAICLACALPCLLWAVLLRCIPDKYAATVFGIAGRIWHGLTRPLLKISAVMFKPVSEAWKSVRNSIFSPAKRFCQRAVAKAVRKKAGAQLTAPTIDEENPQQSEMENVISAPQPSYELPRQPPPITLTTVN